MFSESQAMMRIGMLYNLCKEHAKSCSDKDCGISVFMMKLWAEELVPQIHSYEQHQVKIWLADWPI